MSREASQQQQECQHDWYQFKSYKRRCNLCGLQEHHETNNSGETLRSGATEDEYRVGYNPGPVVEQRWRGHLWNTLDTEEVVKHLNELHTAARAGRIAIAALTAIKADFGKVCEEYEICTHESCKSSYEAWSLADDALDAINQGAT